MPGDQPALGLVGGPLDVVRRRAVGEIHVGGDQQLPGSDHRGEEERHRVHQRQALDLPAQLLLDATRRGPTDEQRHVRPRQGVGDREQQQADHDGRGTVPHRVAGDLLQEQAERRQDQADQRGAVLEGDRLDGGVRRCGQIPAWRRPPFPGGPADLPDGLEPGGSLEEEGDPQDDVGDQRVALLLTVHDRRDALPHREAGAEGERGQGGEEGPEVGLPPVAHRVLVVGRPVAPSERDEQQHLGDGVGQRVRCLRQHGRGVAEQAADQFGDGDGEVRSAREDHGAGALAPGGPLGTADRQRRRRAGHRDEVLVRRAGHAHGRERARCRSTAIAGGPQTAVLRRRCSAGGAHRTPTRSTTKTSVAPGLMTPPAPRSP